MTDTAVASSIPATIPTIPVDTIAEDPQSKPFLGIVTEDAYETPTLQDGTVIERWHLAVRPVDYQLSATSKTGAWHCSAPVKGSKVTKGSKLAVMLEGVKNVFGSEGGLVIMQGKLVGKAAYWERRSLRYARRGQDDIVVDGVLVAVAPASTGELTRALALPLHVYVEAPTGDGPGSVNSEGQTYQAGFGAATPNGKLNLTPEQTTLLLAAYDGRTKVEAARFVAQNADAYADVRSHVFDGRGLEALAGMGLVAVVDGKVTRLDAVEG